MSPRMSFAVLVLLVAGCSGPAPVPPASPSPESAPAETATPDDAAAAEAGSESVAPPVDAAAPAGAAPADAPPPVAALYTEEQARRGQRAFRRVCSECHYTSEFRGPVFTDAWARRTARDFYRELRRTMPDDNPGGLPRQTYVDVMAYILELNGYPAGSEELPPDDAILESFRLTPPQRPGGGPEAKSQDGAPSAAWTGTRGPGR